MHPRAGWTPSSEAPGTLPGPQTGVRLTYLTSRRGAAGGRTRERFAGRTVSRSGGGAGIEGGAAEEELRSYGRAGRFVSTARSRPYVTMATARAGAGPEPEPPEAPGSGTPSDRAAHALLSSWAVRTRQGPRPPPPPGATATATVVTLETQESLAKDGEDPESPKPRARSYCRAGTALLSHTGHSKALRSPSPPHLSSTKLCPRNQNSLKGEERAIQSDKLLSNWYPVHLLQQVQSGQQRTTPLLLLCHHHHQQALILLHFWSPANQARHLPCQGLP